MPHHVAVGRNAYFTRLDGRFSGDPKEFLPVVEQALSALESGRSLYDLAKASVDSDAAEHFARDWLGEWWPDQQPVEPILRQGLIIALKRALDTGLPMSTLTVAGLDEFAVSVVESPNQVTMVITTPAPPDPSDEPQPGVMVVRRNGENVIVE